jgi:hypothetical protein
MLVRRVMEVGRGVKGLRRTGKMKGKAWRQIKGGEDVVTRERGGEMEEERW